MSVFAAAPARQLPAVELLEWPGPPTRTRVFALVALWALVAVSAGTADLRSTAVELVVSNLVVGLTCFIAGLLVWGRQPNSAFGPLMVAVGFVWFNGDLVSAGSSWIALYAFVFANAALSIVVWLVFAYPTGTISRGYERMAVIGIIAYLWLERVAEAVLMREGDGWFECNLCEADPLFFRNPIAVSGGTGAFELVESIDAVVAPALAGVVFVLLAVRFFRSTPAARRALSLLWLATVLFAAHVAIDYLVISDNLSDEQVRLWGWAADLAFALVPLAFLAGILHVRLLRGPVGRLVDDLDALEVPDLQRSIGRALGDPTAEVFFSSDSGYTDTHGRPVAVPLTDGRGATQLTHRGVVLGVLVHDPALLSQPELVATVCSAAGMALANERLRAQVLAQLAEVEASRYRILQATDAARRQIERDLHDGAQQRLVALRLQFRLAASQSAGDTPEAAALTRGADELEAAIADLRELAQGIHPSVLTDEGLTAALEVLVQRSGLAVELSCDLPARPSVPVEAAAYFLVAEALSNVAKHARATSVALTVTSDGDALEVTVADDGVGGANLDRGTGLLGVRDRVAAIGGILELHSPPGQGTTMRARLPLDGV